MKKRKKNDLFSKSSQNARQIPSKNHNAHECEQYG